MSLAPHIRERLDGIYRRLQDDIAATGVVCRQRGLCCDFEKMDHVLFCSTLELENMASAPRYEAANASGRLCPFWKDGMCEARDVRPLGCRVYYCDTSYTAEHSQRVYEKYHRDIEELARESNTDYAYVPMIAALARHKREGRFFDPEKPYALWD